MTGPIFISDDLVLLLFFMYIGGGGVFIYTLFILLVIHSISLILCVGAKIVLQVIGQSAMIFTLYYFLVTFYFTYRGGGILAAYWRPRYLLPDNRPIIFWQTLISLCVVGSYMRRY